MEMETVPDSIVINLEEDEEDDENDFEMYTTNYADIEQEFTGDLVIPCWLNEPIMGDTAQTDGDTSTDADIEVDSISSENMETGDDTSECTPPKRMRRPCDRKLF